MSSEDRTDSVLDSIDGALSSYDAAMPDAMRWVPPEDRDEDEEHFDPWAETPVTFYPQSGVRLGGNVTFTLLDDVRDPAAPTLAEVERGYTLPLVARAVEAAAAFDRQVTPVREIITASSAWSREGGSNPLDDLLAAQLQIDAAENYRPRFITPAPPDGIEDWLPPTAGQLWVIPEQARFEQIDLTEIKAEIQRCIEEIAANTVTVIVPLRYHLDRWVTATPHAGPKPLCIDGHAYHQRRRNRRKR